MLSDGAFDLGRVAVFAAADDHVFHPVNDIDVAAIVLADQITAVKPTTAECISGCFVVLVVARLTIGPRETISLTSPWWTFSPFSSTKRNSTLMAGRPTEPRLRIES